MGQIKNIKLHIVTDIKHSVKDIHIDTHPSKTPIMTRGNQRELSRVKAEKRKEKYAKEGSKDFVKRKEADSDIMREKQKKAEERKAAEAAGQSSSATEKGKGKGK